mgnify:CR=1 FL=1
MITCLMIIYILDCCNAILYGLPDVQIKRLQHMLHIAARILTLSPSSESIVPVLKDLHWLPVEQRIQYKILLLTFKAVNGLAPTYLSDLLLAAFLQPGLSLLETSELEGGHRY